MLKVCVATTAFPRWAGDGEAPFLWEAVRAISSEGVCIRVVAMHSPGAKTHECIDGIDIVRPLYWWPQRWEMLRRAGQAGLPATLRRHPFVSPQLGPFAIAHAVAIARCAKDCDLVHAHWTLSAGLALLTRVIHRRPVVATVHGSDVFEVTRSRVGSWVTREVLKNCDCVTAVSSALKKAVVAVGIPEDEVQVISNGIDTRRYTPPVDGNRDDVVLFVGSLIPRKGVRYLLEAMPEVLRDFPSCRLVLIGDGPLYSALVEKAGNLGLTGRIAFQGFQPPDEVRAWMQRARVVVVPSLEEAQGVVLLEALACGTPVVASRVGGIPEVVTPAVGSLVPPADVHALSEAIRGLLAGRERWAAASRGARELAVERYDWRDIARKFVHLYSCMAG
jgi:glycosyltransferase involved in cell wall biosynthesis